MKELDVVNNKLVILEPVDIEKRAKRREWAADPQLRVLEANQPEYLMYRQKQIDFGLR